MKIKLSKNVVKSVLTVSGPQVSFTLADAGQANVAIHVTLSDGTHFHFPDGSGVQTIQSTVLPPGEYACSVMVAAFSHGAFGTSYDSTVSIAGQDVATASGDIDDDSEEHASKTFALVVS